MIHRIRLSRRLAVVLVALAAAAGVAPLLALTVNLAMPYGVDPTPPRSAEMVFYSSDEDFLFPAGPVRIVCQAIKHSYRAEWTLTHNRLKKPLLRGECFSRPDVSFAIDVPTDDLAPGFYDLHVTVYHSRKQTSRGETTFGYRVDEYDPPGLVPDGFEAFWKKAVAEIRAVPLKLNVEPWKTFKGKQIDKYNVESACIPESYDPRGEIYDQVEVFKVRFDGVEGVGGSAVYGLFAKPAGDGPFPGLLVLPGAGNAPRPAPLEHARHGFAALDIQVHNQPVDLPKDKYKPLPGDRAPADAGPEALWQRAVYLNALQGLEALSQLPGVDAERLCVAGSSQGGQLAVFVAAMDDRVRAGVADIAYFGCLPWSHWVRATNARRSDGGKGYSGQDVVRDNPGLTRRCFYDTMNFAPRVKCPMFVSAGLIDFVSPATSTWAIYRKLGSKEKGYLPCPTTSHDWVAEADRRGWRFLWKHAGVQPPEAEGR